MSNNLNTLPTSGPLTLQNIADAFYLARPYKDMSEVDINWYYGDVIKFYHPSSRDGSTDLPLSASQTIQVSNFYGKGYGWPINVVNPAGATVSNFNLYTAANAVAMETYNTSLSTRGVPFFITFTNNGTVNAPSNPAILNTSSFGSAGRSSFTVPGGTGSIHITAEGGGGGGGGSDCQPGIAGSPGQVVVADLPVIPGDVLQIDVGGGGGGGNGGSLAGGGAGGSSPTGLFNGGNGGSSGAQGGSGSGGGGGGATAIYKNNSLVLVAGAGGGGGGGGCYGPGLPPFVPTEYSPSTVGSAGGNRGGGKYDDGGGGAGGGGGYPNGGRGGDASGPRGHGGSGDRGGYAGCTGKNLIPAGGTSTTGANGGDLYKAGGSGKVDFSYYKVDTDIQTPALILSGGKTSTATFNSASFVTIINNGTIVGADASLYDTVISNTYTSNTTFTVPQGVTQLEITALGGGGGGGGSDVIAGHSGYAGHVVTGKLPVSPGSSVSIYVGGGGGPGSTAQGGSGGTGGTSTVGTAGGTGRNSGTSNSGNGAGGGGGAATAVQINGVTVIVAAGGGGGGGAAYDGGGLYDQVNPPVYSTTSNGGTGDGAINGNGGGGGGGGGYPLGGAAGANGRGDGSGHSGSDGQDLVPAGFNSVIGSNGGVGGSRGAVATAGGNGYVVVNYVIGAPGGDALYIRQKNVYVLNNGQIIGGKSSSAYATDRGYSINGFSHIINTVPGNTTNGNLSGAGIVNGITIG